MTKEKALEALERIIAAAHAYLMEYDTPSFTGEDVDMVLNVIINVDYKGEALK